MSALMKIKNAGFDVSLNGDNFRITPASFLSTRQREFLKLHNAEIINELQAETIAIQTEVDNFVSCADCLHFKCKTFTSSTLLKNNRYHWFRKPEANSARRRLLLDSLAPETRSGTVLCLVELDGIEPTTPCLQSRCSPN